MEREVEEKQRQTNGDWISRSAGAPQLVCAEACQDIYLAVKVLSA